MLEAIAADGEGHRASLAGDAGAARAAYRVAVERYRASWESAPPASYGRLVGLLKSAVLASEPEPAARYVRGALGDDAHDSPVAAYALAVAALVEGADEQAVQWADAMGSGSGAFGRAAAAIRALARRDAEAYAATVAAIVEDFEGRADHLTGVPIADTALMLETLAARRGMAAGPASRVMPAARG